MSEFNTIHEQAPLTGELRGHFISPGEAAEGVTDEITAGDVNRFRRPFTSGSESYTPMPSQGVFRFGHEFTIPNPLRDRMTDGRPRIPAKLELDVPLTGAKRKSQRAPSLRLSTPIADDDYPGWMEVAVEPSRGSGRYGMRIQDTFDRYHSTAALDHPPKWGEPSQTTTRYNYSPGTDNEWHKTTLSTYRLRGKIWTSDNPMDWGTYIRVLERDLPISGEEKARAMEMYGHFWGLLERVEKVAAEKPAGEYYAKRLSQMATSSSEFAQRLHVAENRHATGWSKAFSSMITINNGPPVFDLSIPEHRELYEKLKPTEQLPAANEEQRVNIAGVEGLYSWKWPD